MFIIDKCIPMSQGASMEQHISHPDESEPVGFEARPTPEEEHADGWQDRLDAAIDNGVLGGWDSVDYVIGLVMLGRV